MCWERKGRTFLEVHMLQLICQICFCLLHVVCAQRSLTRRMRTKNGGAVMAWQCADAVQMSS